MDLLKFWTECRDHRAAQLEAFQESLREVEYMGGKIQANQYSLVHDAERKLEHAEKMVEFFELKENESEI